MLINSASSSPWSSLPSDLLGLLFGRLAPRDLLAAAAVCRAWQRAATADIVWAPHLAARVAPRSSSEAVLAMRRAGALAPLTLRDQYALCLKMGSRALPYAPELGAWLCGVGSAPHLEVIRDAAQLGFDPLRHTAPSWANALRLMSLWAVRGTRAVAAVATTCSHANFFDGFDAYLKMITAQRRRAFRALLLRCVWLIQVALIAACVSLVVACRWWLPSLAVYLIAPLSLLLLNTSLDLMDAAKVSVPSALRVAAVAAASLAHPLLVHHYGATLPWSLKVVAGRILFGSLSANVYKRRMHRVAKHSELIRAGFMWAMLDLALPVALMEQTDDCPPVRDVRNLWQAVNGNTM